MSDSAMRCPDERSEIRGHVPATADGADEVIE
jgi:hypothetical protein